MSHRVMSRRKSETQAPQSGMCGCHGCQHVRDQKETAKTPTLLLAPITQSAARTAWPTAEPIMELRVGLREPVCPLKVGGGTHDVIGAQVAVWTSP